MSISPTKRERSPRTRSRFSCPLSVAGVPLVLFLFGACRSPSISGSPSAHLLPAGPPLVEISPNQRLGLIVWVHPERETVLIELDPHVAPPIGGHAVSRDHETLAPSAYLRWLDLAEGPFHAARLLAGNPNPGDEVVTPGPELREWAQWLPTDAP
jgi:hypothetical protein